MIDASQIIIPPPFPGLNIFEVLVIVVITYIMGLCMGYYGCKLSSMFDKK